MDLAPVNVVLLTPSSTLLLCMNHPSPSLSFTFPVSLLPVSGLIASFCTNQKAQHKKEEIKKKIRALNILPRSWEECLSFSHLMLIKQYS